MAKTGKSAAKKLFIGLGLASVAIVVYATAAFVNGSSHKVYVNQGPAMEPTIKDGDRVKARVIPPGDVKHGDIIIFVMPGAADKRLIKRVVGLPGDTVEIADGRLVITRPGGTVYNPPGNSRTPGAGRVTVSSGTYYVLGDNRENSFDSRAFGLVPFSSLQSVVRE